MNKKIIAIAIATAMAAPVAMADMTISGNFGGDFVNTSKGGSDGADSAKANRSFEDNGASKMEFLATQGSAFGKFGFNMGPGAKSTTSDGATSYNSPVYRDYYLGYNFDGGSSFQFGKMAGAAKNIEKDSLIATFLQIRNTYAEARTDSKYGSSGFISNLIQYKMKAGGATIKVQLDPTDNAKSSSNEGHVALAVTGNAGAVRYWASYNNGVGGDKGATGLGAKVKESNTKAGVAMKFGTVGVSLNLTSAATDTSGTNVKWNAAHLEANMGLGNGLSVIAGTAATSGDSKGTFSRLAIVKALNAKARIYGGFTSNKKDGATASDQVGVGMSVKF